MNKRTFKRIVVTRRDMFLASLLVALFLVGSSVAQGKGSDSNLLHLCVNNNSGQVKVVGPGETCKKNATAFGLPFVNEDGELVVSEGDVIVAEGDLSVADGNLDVAGNVGISGDLLCASSPCIHSLDIADGEVNTADLADGAITSDKLDTGLSGDLVPSGAVMFFHLTQCPSGWSELTDARGRYLVGIPEAEPAELGMTVGTALNFHENRAVGRHSHGVDDPGHLHKFATYEGGPVGDPRPDWARMKTNTKRTFDTQLSETGISIKNAGSVPGTNAPYLQLLVCQKD